MSKQLLKTSTSIGGNQILIAYYYQSIDGTFA